MPKAIDSALVLALALAVVAPCAGCASAPDQQTPPSRTPGAHLNALPSARPSVDDSAALRQAVRAHIRQIMSDIVAAEERGDVVDGVPVGSSSNPYDYVGISPAFRQLVSLGPPALPAIVAEIESSEHDGLREYLLAAAGAMIDGDVPSAGGQTWDHGKQWSRQYRADHQ
jgi:hypothetical protein